MSRWWLCRLTVRAAAPQQLIENFQKRRRRWYSRLQQYVGLNEISSFLLSYSVWFIFQLVATSANANSSSIQRGDSFSPRFDPIRVDRRVWFRLARLSFFSFEKRIICLSAWWSKLRLSAELDLSRSPPPPRDRLSHFFSKKKTNSGRLNKTKYSVTCYASRS